MPTLLQRAAHPFLSAGLLMAVLGLGVVPAADAATYSVCASGCDYSTIANAVAAAASGDKLELEPETFYEGDITISKDLTIRAASGMATVDAGTASRAFKVTSGKVVTLKKLKLRGGTDCKLHNEGFTYLKTVWVLGNGPSNPSDRGGIVNLSAGSLTMKDASVVSANASTTLGGGVNNYGDLVIQNSTVIGNTGVHGGGVFNMAGTVSVIGSSFSGNHATLLGGGWHSGPTDGSGTFAFHTSSSYSSNTADSDCDKYRDAGNGDCVN